MSSMDLIRLLSSLPSINDRSLTTRRWRLTSSALYCISLSAHNNTGTPESSFVSWTLISMRLLGQWHNTILIAAFPLPSLSCFIVLLSNYQRTSTWTGTLILPKARSFSPYRMTFWGAQLTQTSYIWVIYLIIIKRTNIIIRHIFISWF